MPSQDQSRRQTAENPQSSMAMEYQKQLVPLAYIAFKLAGTAYHMK
jgi:hypothetical protein